MALLATPIGPEMHVRAARDVYLRDNGFSLEMYGKPTFELPTAVSGWTITLPNPPARRRAVALHDLHHVLTGYGTDWAGELEISAWEVRAGLGGRWVAWLICMPMMLLGFVQRPRRTLAAFRAARGARSLFVGDESPDDWLDLSVAEARDRLGLPASGVAAHLAHLTRNAPSRGPLPS
jgi:hypothetical protein